jgi:hypothetical protein
MFLRNSVLVISIRVQQFMVGLQFTENNGDFFKKVCPHLFAFLARDHSEQKLSGSPPHAQLVF